MNFERVYTAKSAEADAEKTRAKGLLEEGRTAASQVYTPPTPSRANTRGQDCPAISYQSHAGLPPFPPYLGPHYHPPNTCHRV